MSIRRVGRSFGLVGLFLVFVLPFAIILYLLLTEINERVNFAAHERLGVRYNSALRVLLQDVLALRDVSTASPAARGVARGAVGKTLKTVGGDLDALKKLDGELGTTLRTHRGMVRLTRGYRAMGGGGGAPAGPAQVNGLAAQMVRDILTQGAHVGDTSNLILDPELSSYYFMDAVVSRLPPAVDNLGLASTMASTIAARGVATSQERQALISVCERIRTIDRDLRRNLDVAYRNKPSLRRNSGTLTQSRAATARFLALVGSHIVQARNPYGAEALGVAGSTAQSSGFALYDALGGDLDRLLAMRMTGYENKKLFVEIFAVIVLAVTIYVFIALSRSVALRVDAEDATREAEKRFRSIFENASDGIFQMTPEGRYLNANPALARIFGYPTPQAFIEQIHEIAEEVYVDAGRRGEFIWRLKDVGEVLGYETQVTRRDGHVIWISENAHAVRDSKSGAVLFEGTVTEITDRRRMTDELLRAKETAEEANRSKSQFLANMSHELRTPLNAIIGYSEMLQEEAEDVGHDSYVPDLKKIHGAGKHLLVLINDILDLSKVEAGKMELYLEEFDVRTVLNDVVSTIESLVQRNKNTLEVTCGGRLGLMRADLTKVRQVLFNLLSNACKFTENGRITLEVHRLRDVSERDQLEFRVSDSGIGMTKAQQTKLFQAFSQADASTTRKYGGTGLGLAITRRFCELMGGSIEMESDFGLGTTFSVRLPAQVGAPEKNGGDSAAAAPEKDDAAPGGDGGSQAALAPLAGPAAAPASPVRTTAEASLVLVIDDDLTMHDIMRRFLGNEGFEVATAGSGPEGLEIARALHPDVITLDVMMPGMDGWAVLSALKSDAELCTIPVVMVTLVQDRSIGYALGVAEYLTKPVQRDKLLGVLDRFRHEKALPDEGGGVMVVEDDDDTRIMLRKLLERENCLVSEAANGQIALDLLQAQSATHSAHPQLILLDLMMPLMDGFTFVERLRENPQWSQIPVVVVTAKDVGAEERVRLQGSVQQVLQKGAYSREDLLRQIKELVVRGVAAGTAPPAAASHAAASHAAASPRGEE